MQLQDGEVTGVESPVGILPAKDELNLDGLEIDPADLDKLLTIDTARWQQEMGFREAAPSPVPRPPGRDLGGPPPRLRRPPRRLAAHVAAPRESHGPQPHQPPIVLGI